MSNKKLLSRRQRYSYSRSSTHTRGYTSSPSLEPPSWAPRSSLTSALSSADSSRHPPRSDTQSSDLFSTLLFDRETAYRGGAPSSTSNRSVLPQPASQPHNTGNKHSSPTSDPPGRVVTTPAREQLKPATAPHWRRSQLCTEEEESDSSGDDMARVAQLEKKEKDKTTVSKKKAKAPVKKKAKKVVAKSGGKAAAQAVSIVRKRKSEVSLERPTKAAKTGSRANIGRKVNSKESDSAPDKATASDIIEISDSEDDSKIKDDSKTEAGDMLRRTRQQTWGFSDSTPTPQDESEQPITPRPNSPTNPIIDAVQKLRQELESSQNRTKTLQADLEKAKATAKLEQEKIKTKYEGTITKLTSDLDSEKQRVETVTQQREELRAQLQLHQEDAAKYTKLKNEHDALQARHDEAQVSHEEILQDVLKDNESTKSQVTSLKADNARLTAEVQTLKSAAISKFVPPPSPAPSSAFSFSSDEERREENVRKVYIKTKRQFDDLTAATKGLVDCTRGMDLSSFGDFGRCVKRVKVAVETEEGGVVGRNVGRSGSVVGKVDEEEGWGSSQGSSQRSRM